MTDQGWDPTTQTFVDGVDYTPVNFGSNYRPIDPDDLARAVALVSSDEYWSARAAKARHEFFMASLA